MVKGAVVGKAGTALTTFAGVLYAAQLRHSQGDRYRFSVSAQALAALGRAYGSLQQGEFPQELSEEDFSRVVFQMDFPDSLSKRVLPFGRGRANRDLPELELAVVPLVPSRAALAPGKAGWSGLLDSRVLVLVAEAPSVRAAEGAPLGVDESFASLIAALAAESRGSAAPQAAVVWWLPGPPPPTVAEDKSESPALPPPSEARARARVGEGLLSANLPATVSGLKAAGQNAAPASFFAWVRSETKGGARRVARRQQFEVGGVEPDYPYEELAALIEHLGRLAS